jgi:hypothetical protein
MWYRMQDLIEDLLRSSEDEPGPGPVGHPWPPAFDRIKTVSKRDPFERWDLPLSEKQTPHMVEKPKNRRDTMEPEEASWGLHTQEVTGSSPVAPTIKRSDPILLAKFLRFNCSRRRFAA